MLFKKKKTSVSETTVFVFFVLNSFFLLMLCVAGQLEIGD